MRVFISVDIEGVAGVVGREEGSMGNAEYERARRLMTAEASAAVRGIMAAAPDAEVTVADAHGSFRNIIPELLDERARLVRGKPRALAMIEGIQHGQDVAMFVGYHGRAGTGDSVLSHTFTGTLADVRINGRSFGEIGLNAGVAAVFGVPVVLVTGDASVQSEVQDLLGDTTRTAVVKRGIGALAADNLHPNRACQLIELAAQAAIADAVRPPVFAIDGPVTADVDVSTPAYADQAMVVPGMIRLAGRTLRYEAPDYLNAYRAVRLIGALSGLPL